MTRGLPWATRPKRFRQVMPWGGESLRAGVAPVASLIGSANVAGRAPVDGAVAETDAHAPGALDKPRGNDSSRTMAVMSVAAADRSGRLEDALGKRSDCCAE
jgi:hypothetical protein